MKKKSLIAIGVIVIAVGWFLFRPERIFISQTVSESFPENSSSENSNEPKLLTNGRFHSVAHETSGEAGIYKLADGRRVLRLTNFATSNEPDVRVFLVATADALDNDTVTNAGFVELGSLKGNVGDQNYDVPSSVDLATYRAVTVWCSRSNVNFGTAPLSPSNRVVGAASR
ncbi:MAG: DM13 domain-containing protein [Deltaproteobacteria bacterium]